MRCAKRCRQHAHTMANAHRALETVHRGLVEDIAVRRISPLFTYPCSDSSPDHAIAFALSISLERAKQEQHECRTHLVESTLGTAGDNPARILAYETSKFALSSQSIPQALLDAPLCCSKLKPSHLNERPSQPRADCELCQANYISGAARDC